jgi:hypothetical protein
MKKCGGIENYTKLDIELVAAMQMSKAYVNFSYYIAEVLQMFKT